MENASKALIIAGAILLAILIISLGILIFQQASGVVTNNSMDQLEIENFNSQFQQYEGEQKGTAVRALLNKVIANNTENKDTGRTVTVKSNNVTDLTITESTTTAPTSKILAGATYTVSMEAASSGSNQGLISVITIDQKS